MAPRHGAWALLLISTGCFDGSLTARSSPPEASILSHRSGDQVDGGQATELRGVGVDPDGDEADLRATWRVDEAVLCAEAPTATDGSTTCSAQLPEGVVEILLEVRDADNHVSQARVDLLVTIDDLPDPLPPSIALTAPADAAVFTVDETIVLAAVVADGDDPSTDLTVTFTSDVGGVLGTVAPDGDGVVGVEVQGLATGAHTLTAVVTDPAGGLDDDAVSITVDGAPSAPGVRLSPASPTTVDPLVAELVEEAEDPEGAELSYHYAWFVDGASSAASSGPTLPAEATARGQLWRVEVVADDGLQQGPAGADEVTIDNSPPEGLEVAIEPAVPVEGEDALVCRVVTEASDLDGDVLTPLVGWTRDGLVWPVAGPGPESTWLPDDTVPADIPVAGEAWTCTVIVEDGAGGTTSASASVVVDEALPGACPDGNCALRFDGAGAYVEVPHDPALDGGGLPLTVEAWIYYDTIHTDCMVAVRKGTSASGTYDYWLHKNYAPDDSLLWASATGFTAVTWSAVSPGTWIHYAGVYDPAAGEARTYVDGVLSETEPLAGIPTANSDPLRIGVDWDFGCAMDGVLDEIRISSVVRYTSNFTPATVHTADADTRALYHFDAYTGSTAYDSSGAGLHGTLYGATWTTESP